METDRRSLLKSASGVLATLSSGCASLTYESIKGRTCPPGGVKEVTGLDEGNTVMVDAVEGKLRYRIQENGNVSVSFDGDILESEEPGGTLDVEKSLGGELSADYSRLHRSYSLEFNQEVGCCIDYTG